MFDFQDQLPRSVSVQQRPRESGRLNPVIFDDIPLHLARTGSASSAAFDAPGVLTQASQTSAQDPYFGLDIFEGIW